MVKKITWKSVMIILRMSFPSNVKLYTPIVSNYALDWNMMNIARYATSFKFMKMWFYHVGCINIVKVV